MAFTGNAAVVSSYPALRLLSSSTDQTAFVAAALAAPDGGGGTYAYVATDTSSGCLFTGSVSGTTLTVSSVSNGALAATLFVNRGDTGASIATILPFGTGGTTGTGGTGTYALSASASISGPLTFTADNNSSFVVATDGGRWFNVYNSQRTAAEIAAGVTPLNYSYPPGNVFRYYTAAQIAQTQAFSSSPTLDCSAAINTAIQASTGDIYFPTGIHYISAPIYIPATVNVNLRFVGESRTNTKIEPMANSIADALNINAVIINQQYNGKFSLHRMRISTGDYLSVNDWSGFSLHAVQPLAWSSSVGYVAGAIVILSGSYYVCIAANTNQTPPNATYWALCGTNSAGYTAAACNYIFSGSIDQCWFDASSVQPFFVGGLNNYFVTNVTFEFQKGCFSFTGSAADVHFTDISLSSCYDYFIQSTQGFSNILSIRGLHSYTHHRGVLFNISNASAIEIDGVVLQAAYPPDPNLGGVGIGSFTNINDLQITGLNVMTSSTLKTGATATQLTFSEVDGMVSDSLLDGCDVGIDIAGGANRLSFDHVDIVNTQTAAFQVTGAASGVITASSCNWSDGQNSLIIFTSAASFDFYLSNMRLLNAGIGGIATNNILNVDSSGIVRLTDCYIGQNNSSAVAAYYIDASGSGSLEIVDPRIIGAPPSGWSIGTQAVEWDGIDSTMPGAPALTPAVGGSATYTSQLGRWSLKQKIVTFYIDITISVIGTGSATTILGLPFTSSSTYYGGGVVHFFSGSVTNVVDIQASVTLASTNVTLRSLTAAAAGTSDNNILGSGSRVIISGSYPL